MFYIKRETQSGKVMKRVLAQGETAVEAWKSFNEGRCYGRESDIYVCVDNEGKYVPRH